MGKGNTGKTKKRRKPSLLKAGAGEKRDVSKTNVWARQEQRRKAKICKICKGEIQIVYRVNWKGKKEVARICCEVGDEKY